VGRNASRDAEEEGEETLGAGGAPLDQQTFNGGDQFVRESGFGDDFIEVVDQEDQGIRSN
jgi:hypothetical protein